MMLIIKPSSSACERIFSKCARIMTKYRSAMEVDTLDSCVFLDKNPYLFEHALEVIAERWRGTPIGTNKPIPTKVSKDSIKSMTIDWNYVFNSENDNISDSEVIALV